MAETDTPGRHVGSIPKNRYVHVTARKRSQISLNHFQAGCDNNAQEVYNI